MSVLPGLVAWCVAKPADSGVFEFAVEGFVRLARLASPAEALALMDSLPDAAPFQTVRDALIACDRREHLATLAPERQSVALALMEKFTAVEPSGGGARDAP